MVLNLFRIDHFHVHIVNLNYAGFKGVSAGQAHLLEDIISSVDRPFRNVVGRY